MGSTRREGAVPAYVNLSASSMLMIAMQYTSNPGRPQYWLLSKHKFKNYCSQMNLFPALFSSLSLSVAGMSHEAQTGSVEGNSAM